MSAGIAPELLDALHARAAEGMREDAPEEAAEAREDLLTIYLWCHARTLRLDPTLDDSHSLAGDSWTERSRRERELQWREEDLRGFAWIDRLAESGHEGAKQLRARVFRHAAPFAALAGSNPERVAALAQEVPTAGLAMARRELAKEAPNLDELCRWLQSMHDCVGRDLGRPSLPGEEVRGALAVLDIVREMRVHSASAVLIDREFLRGQLAPTEFERLRWRSSETGRALHRLATLKLASADAAQRSAGERLLARAAELGSEEAQDAILAQSADPKTICRWLPPEPAGAVAEAVDLLRAAAGEPGKADLQVLMDFRKWSGNLAQVAAVHGREPFAGKLLHALARLRLDAVEAGGKEAGWALLEKAAERGSWAAQLELYRRSPDAELLARRLESGGEPVIASALRELCAIAGPPEAQDLELLGAAIASERIPDAGQLLHALAQPRLQRGDGSAQSHGARLLRRAAELGSADAKMAIVVAAFERATDRRAFVSAFLQQHPNSGSIGDRLCLRLGAMVERGELGATPDAEEAVDWYAKGLRRARPGPAAWERDGDFCHAVATALDKRWRVHQVDDPALALAWHARGLAAGNNSSFQAWLEAFLEGSMGLQQDPVQALANVRRFKSAGASPKDALMRLGSKLRSAAGRIAQTDAALGVRWYETAAELGSADAHFRIGCLYLKGGNGLAPDAAQALAWFDKGAALGDLDCKLARLPEGAVAMGLTAGPAEPIRDDAMDRETKYALIRLLLAAGRKERAWQLLGSIPEDELTVEGKLVLAERLLAEGARERAWHLLNQVVEHGTATERERAGRLTNPQGRTPPLGSGLDSLEIV